MKEPKCKLQRSGSIHCFATSSPDDVKCCYDFVYEEGVKNIPCSGQILLFCAHRDSSNIRVVSLPKSTFALEGPPSLKNKSKFGIQVGRESCRRLT